MTRKVNGKPETEIYIPELDQYYTGAEHVAMALDTDSSSVYKALRGERERVKSYTVRWTINDDGTPLDREAEIEAMENRFKKEDTSD